MGSKLNRVHSGKVQSQLLRDPLQVGSSVKVRRPHPDGEWMRPAYTFKLGGHPAIRPLRILPPVKS